MVSRVQPVLDRMMAKRGALGLVLVILVSSGCQRGRGYGGGEKREELAKVALGEVRVGKESIEFYIADRFDASVLGFSVSTGAGSARYFPIFASTSRGIPPVVLEVFASKAEAEMWVRSSWSDDELLAYHRIGAETSLTQWGEMKSFKDAVPDHLSGGALPFPALIMGNVVKKAVFKHQ
jgi:hypothetical protein